MPATAVLKSVSMKCEECKVDYPEELLNPLASSSGDRNNVCGICALEIGNRATGFKRTRFAGVIAEAMRQAAIQWRKKGAKK